MLMLNDCISKDRSVAEIFMVQSGRAAALAKSTRDRFTQAVLPVDGAIDRTEGAPLDEILENDDFQNIVASLGVGICLDSQSAGSTFRIDRLRYGKIILVTDESPEGASIRTQIVLLLHRFMRPLLQGGCVYTLPVTGLATMTESKFAETIMSPATRSLTAVEAGASLESTLTLKGLPIR